MAQAQQMLNSMTPEQRQQLQELSNQLMEDMDLQFQMQQLADNLRDQFRRWAGVSRTTSMGSTRSTCRRRWT